MKWFEQWVGAPMAAPESPRLRTMRLVWMALLLSTAVVILGIPVLKLFLSGAQVGLLGLTLVTLAAIHSVVYLLAKQSADNAHLDQLIARDRGEERA